MYGSTPPPPGDFMRTGVLWVKWVKESLASPQTWMRDKRTPKDVCGEAKESRVMSQWVNESMSQIWKNKSFGRNNKIKHYFYLICPLASLLPVHARPISDMKSQIGRGTQRQFSENICSEDEWRSRIFGTFVVKFLACLPLLGFSNRLKNGIIAHF